MELDLGRFPLEVQTVILDKVESRRDKYECTLLNRHFYKVMSRKLWETPMQLDATHELATAPPIMVRSLLMDRAKINSLRTTHLGHHVRKIRFNHRNLVDTMMLCLTMMPFLESLHLDSLSTVKDETMFYITVICPRLKVLKLNAIDITDQVLVAIGKLCRLHVLELSRCDRLTPSCLLGVRDCGLRKLSLLNFSRASVDETARDICYMDRLTHLRFEDCRGIEEDFIERLQTKVSPTDPHLPLPRLLFFSVDQRARALAISPKRIVQFAEAHPALYQLSVSLFLVMEPMLTMIADAAPVLHEVTLRGRCNLASEEVRTFIRRCKRLEYFVLWDCRLPARCFPEAQRLYDPEFPHFRLRTAELANIRSNTHICFSPEDDELQPSDHEEAWTIAPFPGIHPNLDSDDDSSNSDDDDSSDFDDDDDDAQAVE